MAYECDDDIDRKQYEVNQAYEEIAQEVSSDKRFDTGESFVNEDRGFNARYTFTGKELDKETGYQYFGARYNKPARLGWLSVDPLSDKYPSFSPYVYCANNPIKCIDPDGRNPIYGQDGKLLGTDDNGLQGDAIIMNKENFHQGTLMIRKIT